MTATTQDYKRAIRALASENLNSCIRDHQAKFVAGWKFGSTDRKPTGHFDVENFAMAFRASAYDRKMSEELASHTDEHLRGSAAFCAGSALGRNYLGNLLEEFANGLALAEPI